MVGELAPRDVMHPMRASRRLGIAIHANLWSDIKTLRRGVLRGEPNRPLEEMQPTFKRFSLHCARPVTIRHKWMPRRGSIRRKTTASHVLTVSQPWLRLNCSLGEGPFWEEDTNTLRFLDVEKQKVHRVDLNVGPSSHEVLKEYDISIGLVTSHGWHDSS